MITERQVELSEFVETWQGKPRSQVVEEIASYCIETHGSPDYYPYYINALGELISPSAECRVKDAVKRSNAVGRAEYRLVEATEAWLKKGQEGIVVWVSPPDPDFYPTTKITISEIGMVDGQNALLNRGIVLLDFNQQKAAELVEGLRDYCQESPLQNSIDEVRATPLILPKADFHWTYILEELVPGLNLVDIRSGADKFKKTEMLGQASRLYDRLIGQSLWVDVGAVMEEANRVGMIGASSASCPRTFRQKGAFGLFGESSYFECPRCHGRIESGKGITTCPHCGARKEDYSKCG